jgi:hypothetical protein
MLPATTPTLLLQMPLLAQLALLLLATAVWFALDALVKVVAVVLQHRRAAGETGSPKVANLIWLLHEPIRLDLAARSPRDLRYVSRQNCARLREQPLHAQQELSET